MMTPALPPEAVVGFLESLRSALAGFVASLERQLAVADGAATPNAALAVEHGLAVHRASLAWADTAITRLTASTEAGTASA